MKLGDKGYGRQRVDSSEASKMGHGLPIGTLLRELTKKTIQLLDAILELRHRATEGLENPVVDGLVETKAPELLVVSLRPGVRSTVYAVAPKQEPLQTVPTSNQVLLCRMTSSAEITSGLFRRARRPNLGE